MRSVRYFLRSVQNEKSYIFAKISIYIYDTNRLRSLALMIVLCFFFAGSGSNSTGELPQSLPQVKVDTKGKANVSIPINLPIATK